MSEQLTDALLDAIAAEDVPLLAGASGAALVFRTRIRLIGVTPAMDHVESIVRRLGHGAEPVDDRSPDPLPGELEPPTLGTLAFAIDSEAREFLIWFRSPARESWTAGARVQAARIAHAVLLKSKRKLAALVTRMAEEQRARAVASVAIGHELRNSLGIVGGWTHVLRHGPEPGLDSRGLDVIGRTIRIQRKLVDDLVEASRNGLAAITLEVHDVDLARLLEDMLTACRPALDSKDLRLEVDLAPELGITRGDPERLGQVLANVFANAVKFTPVGGTVRVVAKRAERHAEIRVTDSGIGISAEFLPAVFEAFRKAQPASEQGGGLGLGLTIAKQLVELHGGKIIAESAGLGRGATFRILLPT